MLKFATLATLGILIGFKFFAAIFESKAPSLDNVVPALMYAALFGSPQLFWFTKCLTAELTATRLSVVAWVAFVFVVLSIYFGSFPGSNPPSWGGSREHLEVPAALVGEWIVALLALIPFRLAKAPA